MNGLLSMLRGNVRQYGMIIALAAIVILFQITTDGRAAQAASTSPTWWCRTPRS